MRSPEQRRTFVLKGIDSARIYRFTDPYTENHFEISGATLLSKGLEFDLPEMSLRVLLYAAVFP